MFPGIGGFNPKKMQAIMKQIGMSQEEIPASKVIIEKKDNTKIIINNPSVAKISMQGQESFQISGEISKIEKDLGDISKDDVKIVMEKTGSTEQDAKKALKESNGDLAEAILKLNSKNS